MGKIKLIALIFFFFLIKFLIAQTTIQFAGINWNIRSGTGGPGPNNWSNSSNSVWVDAYEKPEALGTVLKFMRSSHLVMADTGFTLQVMLKIMIQISLLGYLLMKTLIEK